MRTLPTSLALPIMVSAAFISASPAKAAESLNFRTAAPSSFNDLDADRQLVVDVYVRGESVGQANIRVSRGKVVFDSPAELVRRIPNLLPESKVADWLREPLPGNFGRACGRSQNPECGFIDTNDLAVILDEDRFRLDLFIHTSQFASTVDQVAYLPEPEAGMTFISRFGGTVAVGEDSQSFLLQNRTVLAFDKFRVRADSSVMSKRGIAFDNLSIERDRKDWRQIAGLFWAPGSDLVGRRKIIGAGVMTQLETRLNRRTLIGTPLSVSLQASARVDLLIDGRLVASRIYSPGEVLLDTSTLPDGSYDVEIRISENGRPERVERRFFNKGTEIAPAGRPMFGAMAGFLADERGRPDWSLPYYQVSAAVRISPDLGVDARILGSSSKAIGEAGVIWLTPIARVRLAALLSSKGDRGAVLRASTAYGGPVSLSFDLRTIKSANGAPILPETRSLGSFSEDNDEQIGDVGSYTQGSVYLTARWRRALLRLSGLYRKSGGEEANYSIAGSIEAPVLRSDRWNLLFHADLRKTDRDVAALFGFRASIVNPAWTGSASAGLQYEEDRDTTFAGEISASATTRLSKDAELSGNAALASDRAGTSARAGALLSTSSANLRGDLLHSFGGDGSTQFAGSFDTAIVSGATGVSLGARNVTDGAVVVVPMSEKPDQEFEVLVDGGVRGIATGAKPLTLFLQPFEQYRVRIRPTGQTLSNYDGSEKVVALYPGKVVTLKWASQSTLIAFGRVVDAGGEALANARISGRYAIGQTDDRGYFQIEAAGKEELQFAGPTGRKCVASLGKVSPEEAYIDVGVITCH